MDIYHRRRWNMEVDGIYGKMKQMEYDGHMDTYGEYGYIM